LFIVLWRNESYFEGLNIFTRWGLEEFAAWLANHEPSGLIRFYLTRPLSLVFGLEAECSGEGEYLSSRMVRFTAVT